MRIAIIGPQNTGKSTFLQDLLVAFPQYTTPKETYRGLIQRESLGINQKTSKKSQAAIRDFLYAQIMENTKKDILFDRSVIDNYVYSQAVSDSAGITAEFLSETKRHMYDSLKHLDMIFFVPTAVSIKLGHDGVRDIDTAYLDKINHLFIEILFEIIKETKLPVHLVSGTRKERVALVEKFLRA